MSEHGSRRESPLVRFGLPARAAAHPADLLLFRLRSLSSRETTGARHRHRYRKEGPTFPG